MSDPTLVTHGHSTASGSSFATASVTLTAGRLHLLAVVNTGSSSGEPTVSGGGLTWAVVQSGASTLRRTTLFIGTGVPAAGALTIDFGANTAVRCAWGLFEFGADFPGDASAIVQSTAGTDGSSPYEITLSSAITPGNAVFAFIGIDAQRSIDPGTGYVELLEEQQSGQSITLEVAWSTAPPSDTVSWTMSSGSAGVLAVELAPVAVSGTVVDLTGTHVAAEALLAPTYGGNGGTNVPADQYFVIDKIVVAKGPDA